jgi:hypothetical protein
MEKKTLWSCDYKMPNQFGKDKREVLLYQGPSMMDYEQGVACVLICVCVRVCVCVCVCVCVTKGERGKGAHTHTHSQSYLETATNTAHQRERKREREGERQRGRKAGREAGRELGHLYTGKETPARCLSFHPSIVLVHVLYFQKTNSVVQKLSVVHQFLWCTSVRCPTAPANDLLSIVCGGILTLHIFFSFSFIPVLSTFIP